MSRVDEIESLVPAPRTGKISLLSLEEGLATIRAYRRGVSSKKIADHLGIDSSNLHYYIGKWALQHARVDQAGK